MYDPKTVKLTEPIKSIVEWVEELESNIGLYNKRLVRFEKRMKKFEKGIEAIDEKMKRIEKYAK
jgi:peptidoglycan hydrolase CwlO-like protein